MPDLAPLPPIADQPISVVLLARNDEIHLEEVVSAWTTLLDGLNREYELILVDDGGTDRTPELTAALTARFPRLRVIRHEQPRGDGAALRDGLQTATKPLFFYTTADRQYDVADFNKLLPEIDKVHLVSGFRQWQQVPRPLRWLGFVYRVFLRVLFSLTLERRSAWLGWNEWAYRLLARVVFALRLQDVNCLFRLFRREIFARIPIQSDGEFAHVEVLAKANFLGSYMNDEIPVAHRPRQQLPAGPSWGKDFRRVFSHPDFGPAVLPTATAPASPPILEGGPG
jgi:glycosyltransferase involved in cell wall biosynthesis